jgi:hypothetical protein
MTNSRKSFRHSLTLLLAFAILALQAAPGQGPEEANPAAVNAIKAWLKSIDEGRYQQSWDSASSQFQKAITSRDWVAALESARKPAGACTKRTLASVLPQNGLPDPNGKMLKGEFVIAQFQSSFTNLAAALETVTFEKENGTWKASGYFIKPGG